MKFKALIWFKKLQSYVIINIQKLPQPIKCIITEFTYYLPLLHALEYCANNFINLLYMIHNTSGTNSD